MELDDRHVLVTGASRGIGAALATELTARGARVTAVARSADELARVAEATGARPLTADLTVPAEVDGLVARAEVLNGPIDVLVNNAAIAEVGHFAEQDYACFRRHMETNLLAPMGLVHRVLPGMTDRERGTVVFISSMAGELAFPKLSAYSSSKAGLTCFAENLRRDLRRSPVNVLLAVLGEVDTSMMDASRDDAEFTSMIARFPAQSLSAQRVAAELAAAIATDRPRLILPRRIRAAFALRQVPSRALDFVVARPPRMGAHPR